MNKFDIGKFRRYFHCKLEAPLEVYKDCYLITKYSNDDIYLSLVLSNKTSCYSHVQEYTEDREISTECLDTSIKFLERELLQNHTYTEYLEILNTSSNLIKEMIVYE